MDRRSVMAVMRGLATGLVLVSCSVSPSITEADDLPATGPPTTAAVSETEPAVAIEGRPDDENPYPLAGNTMIRQRLHWFVPQPE